jgi:hypothetical protein
MDEVPRAVRLLLVTSAAHIHVGDRAPAARGRQDKVPTHGDIKLSCGAPDTSNWGQVQ